MKRILIISLLVAVPAFAAESSAPEAETAIEAVLARVDTCVTQGDSKCLREIFADDITFAGPYDGGKIIKGEVDVIAAFEANAKQSSSKDVKQERAIDRVRLIGNDHALVDCTVTVTGAEDGGAGENWHSTALVALEGGKWIVKDVRFYAVAPPPVPSPIPPTIPPRADEPAEEDEQPEATPES